MAERPGYKYRVHGLVFASEIELPELAALRVADAASPDVHIRLGAVARPEGVVPPPEPTFLPAPGGAFFEVAQVARYLIERGQVITVEPLPAAELQVLRIFLLGWATAMVCLQREELVLHASAVAFGQHAVAFLGDAGAGKSTLAAHCLQAGGRLVADDLLRIEFVDGRPYAHPGVPFLKLWRPALDNLGRSPDGFDRDYWREDKFLVPFPTTMADTALPLARVYVLEAGHAVDGGGGERISGATAVTALVANSHGFRSIDTIGRRPAHLRDCARLVNCIEVVRLPRRHDLSHLPTTAAWLAATSESACR